MPAAGALSRAALERLAAGASPAARAEAEAEVAHQRARMAERHWRVLSERYREAAIVARAAIGTPEFRNRLARVQALSCACRSARRAFARAHLKAERMGDPSSPHPALRATFSRKTGEGM